MSCFWNVVPAPVSLISTLLYDGVQKGGVGAYSIDESFVLSRPSEIRVPILTSPEQRKHGNNGTFSLIPHRENTTPLRLPADTTDQVRRENPSHSGGRDYIPRVRQGHMASKFPFPSAPRPSSSGLGSTGEVEPVIYATRLALENGLSHAYTHIQTLSTPSVARIRHKPFATSARVVTPIPA